MAKLDTYEAKREERRGNRLDNYYYAIDPDTHSVQRAFGQPKPKPKAIIYLPHYENSLRIEVDIPEGRPDLVQKKLDEYKDQFVNWFGGDKKNGYMWGNRTRRYIYNKVSMKIQGVKVPMNESRALRTLFIYKGLMSEFEAGKTRKQIVQEWSQKKDFQFEQVRRINKYSRKTGVILKTTRKQTTIDRDISSLVKIGVLKKERKGIYSVVKDKSFEVKKIRKE